MKLTAKSTTLIAWFLNLAGILVPSIIMTDEDGATMIWMIGATWTSEHNTFSWFQGELPWMSWAGFFLLALGLAGIHFLVSLLSKNANKSLNRTIAGDICLVSGWAYFIGVYTGGGFVFTVFPIGLILIFLAGVMGLWAGRLTHAESEPCKKEEVPK